MSALLWKTYFEDDFDGFRQLLVAGLPSGRQPSASHAHAATSASPGRATLSLSPNLKAKSKPAARPSLGKSRSSLNNHLSRAEVNSRDAHGVTILHMIASSVAENTPAYATTLLQNVLLDIYVQDSESGWTALHRSLYSGNVSIARALITKDMEDFTSSGGATHAGGLIKIKDREGNSPFDVYAATVASRAILDEEERMLIEGPADEDEGDVGADGLDGTLDPANTTEDPTSIGDELFMFGSNKNLTLGFGDEDDRHFPERIVLKRPDVLLKKLLLDHRNRYLRRPLLDELPGDGDVLAAVKFKPIQIEDVQLSKLHTAVLTTDPQANLYMCGFGLGGRLGTGDEATRFHFCSILGGGLEKRKIVAVGLGQDHTVAVTSTGEVFTWGSNKYGQLGYSLATPNKDEEPVQLIPKQLLGPLKRETILGCSASRTHSVVFTSDALFTFGKNDGQLGIVDSDSRSTEKQITPRKVAASILANGIKMVCAIDKATVFLLENHEVWVFANYGYSKLSFPLNNPNSFIKSSFSAVSRHDGPNHIVKICGGGDTICGLSRTGEIFTAAVVPKADNGDSALLRMRGALSMPQRIWSLRKDHMAVSDVDVGQDGSVIICTKSGSVWKRVKRTKIKQPNLLGVEQEHKSKDYKFSRIPGLTHISAVRANAFGAFSAIRNDYKVLRTQIKVSSSSLWDDIFSLLPFKNWGSSWITGKSQPTNAGNKSPSLTVDHVRQAILVSKDVEVDLANVLGHPGMSPDATANVLVGSTLSKARIPVHQFLLMARSAQLFKMLSALQKTGSIQESESCSLKAESSTTALLLFKDVDILSLLNFVFYMYTDNVLAFWNINRQSPQAKSRYRKVRDDVMKLALHFGMPELERAARMMTNPSRSLHKDIDRVCEMSAYLETGDMEVELQDGKMKLHSALASQRCPFFEGLFHGRAGGSWLNSRLEEHPIEETLVSVDLQHISKESFAIFARYLYSDVEDELFARCMTDDLDDFLDVVLDVLAVANELMVDRLARICQRVLGRYVTTRNACWLLNEVAPCSVTQFKTAALEYICINLEGMLENRLLDELDEELVDELGDAIRANQLAYMPVARSGHAEAELYEVYPELAERSAKARQVKVDYMALQSHLAEDEIKMAKIAKSPALKARSSSNDLMFSMDEDGMELTGGRSNRTPRKAPGEWKEGSGHWPSSPSSSLPREEAWHDAKGKMTGGADKSGGSLERSEQLSQHEKSESPSATRGTPGTPARDSASPWAAASLQTGKLGMDEIMKQANETRTSTLANAFSPKAPLTPEKGTQFAKISQKERKKAMQAQKAASPAEQKSATKDAAGQSKPSPWGTPSAAGSATSKGIGSKTPATREGQPGVARASASPSLTMRQTVAGNASSPKPQSNGTTVQSGTPKPVSSFEAATSSKNPHRVTSSRRSQVGGQPRPVPQSIRHANPTTAAESTVQLSLADILVEQQTEKQVIKEATAKRSLQEIQQEQAFQEWWDQEEAATKARIEQQEAAARHGRRSRRQRGGHSGRGKDRSKAEASDGQNDSPRGSKGTGRPPSGKQMGPDSK